MKVRQYAIILFFISICSGLSLLSFFGHFNEFGNEQAVPKDGPVQGQVDESFFKGVNYYSLVNTKPSFELQSNELSHANVDGVVIAFDPSGVIYRYEKNGDELEPIFFQSKNSRALVKKKEIYLDNDVEINMSNTNLKAQKVSILSNGEELFAYNNVKTLSTVIKTSDQIFINSKSALYRPKQQFFEYKDNVEGLIKRKRAYEESISFKTDLLTLDSPMSLVTLKGNVSLKKDNLDASANRGEVFLENYNKRLKYYALYDDVRLQERLEQGGKPLIRKGFAEKLEGLMSDKKIILTGLPKVFQDKDVIKGNRIVIRENVETVEVDDANTSILLKSEEKNKD